MAEIDFSKYKIPRIRHHSNRSFYFSADKHTKKVSTYPPADKSINWSKIFANAKPPDCIDIGCGLGKFMLRYACNYPDLNILGLEVRNVAVNWINGIIKSEMLGNAGALWYSSANLFPFIEDESVSRVFCLFPDPWVKRRHNKRRVINKSTINDIHRILLPKGKLYLMTDVDELSGYHIEQLESQGGFTFQLVSEDNWDLKFRSNQEEFCLSKGISIKRMICTKQV